MNPVEWLLYAAAHRVCVLSCWTDEAAFSVWTWGCFLADDSDRNRSPDV